MSTINVNAIDKESGSTLTLGGSGTTVQPHASATVSGFGLPAYASNASATDSTVNVDASDNLQFNSGYGSTATAYGCRAWVNFNGTGTVAILASGNVSSITDNGTGDYTVTFTNAMPDANYAFAGTGMPASAHGATHPRVIFPPRNDVTASSTRIIHTGAQSTTDEVDAERLYFAVFR